MPAQLDLGHRVETVYPDALASFSIAVCQAGSVAVRVLPAVSAGRTTLDQAVASLNRVLDQPGQTAFAAVWNAELTLLAKYVLFVGLASQAFAAGT
jgi:hypothetical protein